MGEDVCKSEDAHVCYVLVAKVFDLRIFPVRSA